MREQIAVDIRVVGQKPEVLEFLRLCRLITTFGYHGTGRSIQVAVDGDGSGFLRFEGKKEDGSPLRIEPFTREDIGEVRQFHVDIGE